MTLIDIDIKRKCNFLIEFTTVKLSYIINTYANGNKILKCD